MDRRRINGPENSVIPLPLLNSDAKSTINNISKKNKRKDGRSPEEVRPLFAQPGIVRQANGSALFEAGGIKIVAAVYGPKQITSNQRSFDHHSGARLSCDVRFAPFATLKRTGYSKEAPEMTLAKDLATAIIPSLLLEHLPKSQIDVFVEILQTTSAVDSSSNYSRVSANVLNSLLLAHCVSAASLALADAGFEMMDSVVGCNVGIFKNNNSKRLFWMVDPADDEPETSCSGGGTLVGTCSIAYMPSVGRVTGVVINGDIGDVGFVMECVQVATDASAQILEVVVKKALLFGSDFIKKV